MAEITTAERDAGIIPQVRDRATKLPTCPEGSRVFDGKCHAAVVANSSSFVYQGLWGVQVAYKLGEYTSARQAAVVVDLQWIALGQAPKNFPNASKKVSRPLYTDASSGSLLAQACG